MLASTFARSTSVRRAFDGGIYWLDARDETSPLRVARVLSELLSDARVGELDLVGATNRLRHALAGKRVLVVIDNLQTVESIRPLLHALDANTRVLVTTRQAGILAGSPRLLVGDFGVEEALQFLTDWVGSRREIERSALAALVAECGRHPLALALNGAMLEKGHDVQDLVDMLAAADLQFAEDASVDYAYSTVFKTLDVSMTLLERQSPETAALFRSLPLFYWGEGVTETTIQRFWTHWAGIAAPRARLSLTELVLGAFLRRETVDGTRLVRLHDLWRDYLVLTDPGNGGRHDALVEAWRRDCAGEWVRGPADEYFLRHLSSHLVASGKQREAVELLTGSPAWMERLHGAFESDEPFVEQIERVSRDADTPGEHARLHAARLVVSLRVGAFENADLAALTWVGRSKQARGCARLRDEPAERLRGLLVVAKVLAEKGAPSEDIVREAAREVDRIRDPQERGRALAEVAKAWSALRRPDEVERIEQAREGDPKTRDSLWYGLSELAATVGDFSRAFETARRIEHPWSRWQALRALARRGDVPEAQRDALLEAMESAAKAVDPSDDAEGVLLAINVYWLGQWGRLERAVREARQLSATGPRIQALSFAAGALRHAGHPQASELWTETMEALGAWQPGGRDLDAVSSSVHASLLIGCFDHAEPAARLARDPKERSALLTQVALGALDAEVFAVSERIAAELESPWSDVILARSVAAYLARGRPGDADRVLAAVQSPESRAYALRSRLEARLSTSGGDLDVDTLVADAADVAWRATAEGSRAWNERSLLLGSPRRRVAHVWEGSPDETLVLLLTAHGRAEDARRLADGIEDRVRRLRVRRAMAVLLFRAGDERARPWLDETFHLEAAAPSGSADGIRTTLVHLLSRAGHTVLAQRVAGQDPWLLAHIARERAADEGLSVAWSLAAVIAKGEARAAILAELAARTHTTDPALAHERFAEAIDAVYEIAGRLSRDAGYYAVAEQAARCGCLSQLTKLAEDPRRAEEVPQGRTVSMSSVYAVGHGPRRLTTALVTHWAECGDASRACAYARSVEDAGTRCAAWSAIGAELGPTNSQAANEAFSEAERTLPNIDESSDRSDLAARLCEDLVRAGFPERAIGLLKQAAGEERSALLKSAVAAIVRNQGIEAAATMLRRLDDDTDEARGVLFEAALERPSADAVSLVDVARSLREPAARAVALARAAAFVATLSAPVAATALDDAERAIDALDEPSARSAAALELAGAFAASGRYREALATLPRQAPHELIDTLARWPDGLSLVQRVLPVLSWVRPDWEEFTVALHAPR